MKAIIEINEQNFVKGDLLYFNGTEWVGYSLSAITDPLLKKISSLEQELKKSQQAIDSKLKEYHTILQVLGK